MITLRAPWGVLRRLLQWLAIAVLGLLALALLLIGAVFAINAHDEPLSAQARALLTPPPNPYRPQDNAYLAIEGFDAPPGDSVIAAGKARVDRYNQSVDAWLRDPSPARLTSLGARNEHGLEFTGDMSFVEPLNGSVWADAVRHETQIRALLVQNGQLYRRYLDLLPLRGYYETARPSPYAPYAFVPGHVHGLFLAAVALHLRSPFAQERARALADLQLDEQLWRALFHGEGTLVSKMLAATALQSDFLLLADIIADPEVALPPIADAADALVPVPDLKNWDLGGAFAAEFRVASSLLMQIAQLSPGAGASDTGARTGLNAWLSRLGNRTEGHFYKLNATENLFAQQAAQRIRGARDPAVFYATRDDPPGSLSPVRLSYNPVGKALAALGGSAYENYPLRAWDAAALERLVRLGYEIRRERIEADAIPDFLWQHPEWSTHPADGRPFLWDAARGELRVQTVAHQPAGRRFSIHVWKALAPPTLPR